MGRRGGKNHSKWGRERGIRFHFNNFFSAGEKSQCCFLCPREEAADTALGNEDKETASMLLDAVKNNFACASNNCNPLPE